jgi:2-dehydropantoate 2-reductase
MHEANGAVDGMNRRVGIIGAGPMGMSLGAVLGQHANVVMVERDPVRAEHIRTDGAVVHGLGHQAARVKVVSSIAELGAFGALDAVFVATKTTAIDAVGHELRAVMASIGEPWVVSFQNGIASGEALRARLGTNRVARMVLNYGARLRDDGDVEVVQSSPPHVIGGPNEGSDAVSRDLAALMSAGGMETRAVADIEPDVWLKGIMNAGMNPVAALVNMRIGEVLDSPAVRIVERLVDEGLAVAAGEGIELGGDARKRVWAVYENGRAHLPSMVEDIRAGRSSEVGQLNRQVIEHGQRVGVETPTHALVTGLIDTFDWRVFHAGDVVRAG